MNNKDYGLKNITTDEIILFQKFLGYGNPLSSKIWFIGNEERLINKNELIKDRIDRNCLDKKCGDILNREKNNNFFTKQFDYFDNINDLHYTYKNIAKMGGEDFSKLFISEVFFLPSMSGNLLGKKYNTDEKDRKDFYKNNDLEFLLKERINNMKDILDSEKSNCKQIYIYGNSFYKRSLISDTFFDGIGLGKKGESKIFGNKYNDIYYNKYINKFKKNIDIFIIPFFTETSYTFDLKKEIDSFKAKETISETGPIEIEVTNYDIY